MKEELFGLHSWHLLWAVAAAVGAFVDIQRFRRIGLDTSRALMALLILAIVAPLGGKLHFVLENRLSTAQLLAAPGFRLPGAIAMIALAAPMASRLLGIPTARFLDRMAPGLALTLAIGRIGCFLNGCCFGVPTSLPWGVRFPPASAAFFSQASQGLVAVGATTTLPVHPLQLYFSACSATVAGVLLWLEKRPRYPGEISLSFLVLHAGSKALLDSLRGVEIGVRPTTTGTVDAFVALAAGALLLVIYAWRRDELRSHARGA